MLTGLPGQPRDPGRFEAHQPAAERVWTTAAPLAGSRAGRPWKPASAADPAGTMPEPAHLDDAELARVITSLPRPMAEAAIAAGVLRSGAPQNRPESAGPAAPEPASPFVLAPAWARSSAMAAVLSTTFPDSTAVFGESLAVPPAGPALSPVSRAPLDRPAVAEADHAAAAQPAAEGAGPKAEGEHAGPDLDHLADEVFGILRWRLEAERERTLDWG